MRYHKLKACEQAGVYEVTAPVTEQDLLMMANQVARKRLAKGTSITNKALARDYFQTLYQLREQEVFVVVFLDTQHRVLAFEEMFSGTIDSSTIYPREVVKRALIHNAAAVMLIHNHPSGNPAPSKSDIAITKRLQSALELIDVRTLDHLIVGIEGTVSFAERGLI